VKVDRAEILISCASPSQFPAAGPPEVAFLGRSNVGKSSLLNRLVHRKKLARTSSTPGKTRLVHFFELEGGNARLWFIDLPGYGWARVSRKERESWQRLVERYLERDSLCAAILLQDLRRDVSEDETLLLEWLAERNTHSLVALTKIDKLKPMRRAKRIRELKDAFGIDRERLFATSAQTGEGIDTLWRAIEVAAGMRRRTSR
jgi:GTP-binding protein